MLIKLAPWLFVTLWATGYVGMKLGAPYAEPFTFLSLRFLGVLVVLVPVMLVIGVARLSWRETLRAVFIGAWLHGIYLGAVMWAIKHGMAAGVAALIIALQPIITSVAAAAFLGEDIRPAHWFGLVLGLAGVGVVVFPALDPSQPVAPIATVISCFSSLGAITFATLYQKSRASDMDVRASLVPQFVGASLVVGTGALLFETRQVDWAIELVVALAWLILVLSIGAVSLLLVLLRENAVWRTSTLFYLIPPVTALFAWLLFGETLSLVQVAGMAVVMTGVLIARSTPAQPDVASHRAR